MKGKVFAATLIWFWVVGIPKTHAFQNKRVQNHIEKGRYVQADDLLNKALSRDSLEVDANYLKSRLFLTADYFKFNIDSAYGFVLIAQQNLKSLEAIDSTRSSQVEFGWNQLSRQKNKVDSTAFSIVASLGTEVSFNQFLVKHPTAYQTDSARQLRNAVAFKTARQLNSAETYLSFLQKYPESKEAALARHKYDALLYANSTANGKLKSLENFYREHPESPYKTTTEARIFNIMTGSHLGTRYERFIKRYPEGELTAKATNFLFHLESSANIVFEEDSLIAARSLATKIALPVYKDSKYAFMDVGGEMLSAFSFIQPPASAFCEAIVGDVVVAMVGGNFGLIDKRGQQILNFQYDAVLPLDNGLVSIMKNKKFGLAHNSGVIIQKPNYDQLLLIDGRFVAYKQGGYWGLNSVTNIPLLNAEYDSIYDRNGIIEILKNSRIALVKSNFFLPALDGQKLVLPVWYDEVEFLNGYYLVLVNEDEGVLNQDLSVLVDVANQEITELKEGFWVEKDNKIMLTALSTNEWYDEAIINSFWGAAKANNNWQVLDRKSSSFVATGLDSILIKGDQFLVMAGNGGVLAFGLDTLLVLPASSDYILVSSADGKGEFLIEFRDENKRIFNVNGEVIFEGQFDRAVPKSNLYVLLTLDKDLSLISADGEKLELPDVEAIGQFSEAGLSTLQDGKFGLFDPQSGVVIEPTFERQLSMYVNSIFIGYKDGGYGLVDKLGQALTGFEYEEFRYWNDTSALAKRNFEWMLVSIQGRVLMDGIQDYSKTQAPENEDRIIIFKENTFGLISNTSGSILAPTFSDIKNVGTNAEPIYLAEKHVEEADYYVVVYFNAKGEPIARQAFMGEEYSKIRCNEE